MCPTWGTERNRWKTAVLKTVPMIFLRNDCEMENLSPCLHLAVSFTAWFLWCTCFISFLLLAKEVVTLYNYSIESVIELGHINHKWDHFTSSAFWLGPFMTKANTLEMTAASVFICNILNKTKLNSNKEALKIFLVHLLAWLMLICCWYGWLTFSFIFAFVAHLAWFCLPC